MTGTGTLDFIDLTAMSRKERETLARLAAECAATITDPRVKQMYLTDAKMLGGAK